MREENEEIEQKTPRTLVRDRFSFRDLLQLAPLTLTFPEQGVAMLLPRKSVAIGIHCA